MLTAEEINTKLDRAIQLTDELIDKVTNPDKKVSKLEKILKEFPNTGKDFSGYYAAINWLKENGYSYGSMQRGDPIGIVKGDCIISKWRNLSNEDVSNLDGVISFIGGGPREGTATIEINNFNNPL